LILSAAECSLIILVSRNVRHIQIFAGVPREGASNDSGVVEERNFHRLLLAIVTGMFGNFTQDI